MYWQVKVDDGEGGRMSGFRLMKVSNALLTEFLQGRCNPARCTLPDDAKVVGVIPNAIPRMPHVSFRMESDEWEPPPDGEAPAEITPTYTHMDGKS